MITQQFITKSFMAFVITILLGMGGYAVWAYQTLQFPFDLNYEIGEVTDSYNGVKTFYNGPMRNIHQRNITEDGYNLGLQYQCVEFVKRYYWETYHHQMPNSWGNAKDFYNPQLKDGDFNPDRGLIQYRNPSNSKPKEGELLIFDSTIYNSFGHVAIITKVEETQIEIIQQNTRHSRQNISLRNRDGTWMIENRNILGRLSITEALSL